MTKQEENTTFQPDDLYDEESPQEVSIQTALKELQETMNEEKPVPEQHELPSETKKMKRRLFLIGGLGVAATVVGLGTWLWNETPHTSADGAAQKVKPVGDKLVLQWNSATLSALSEAKLAVPVVARALAIVHTCMYDAWTAYNSTASGTQLGTRLRRPDAEQTLENKSQAISFAAYRALVDLFPAQLANINQVMTRLGYNPANRSTDISTPAGIGNTAAAAVLAFRHSDGSNQLGNLHPGAYSDYTKYRPLNTPDHLKDPNHWQPLEIPISLVKSAEQTFAGAQWANVRPFALSSAAQFMPGGPARSPSQLYTQQAREILQYSAGLTDEHKVIAEYWTYNPMLEQPAGHWSLLTQLVSRRNNLNLDQNVKLFFALTNALLDTGIAVWAAKRTYDSPYPITTINYLFQGKQVRAWAGPGKGIQQINGAYWQPYQPENITALPYPEYCSEYSAFSAAAATVLRSFTGNDQFGLSFTWPAHSSRIEPGTPANDITLTWRTFSEAADQAGLSQRYSGTHFPQGDLDGRTLGSNVGQQVWQKTLSYTNPR